MTHTCEVVAYQKLSNGQVAFRVRCCGNADTDSVLTLAVAVAADPVAKKAALDKHCAKVSQLHDDAVKAEQLAIGDVGQLIVIPPKKGKP